MSHNSKGLSSVITKEYLIEEHYNKKRSIRSIASEHGCDKNSILKYMKKFGLQAQKQAYNQHNRVYAYDQDFFETIDAEEKAYWLGFIMADGYTYHGKKQKKLRIGLGNKDRAHLIKFINSIKGDMDVKLDSSTGCPYVDVNSTKMCDNLSKYNVFPGKSNKEEFPLHLIPEELYRHFIRGLFDGDGGFTYSDSSKTYHFSLASSRKMLLAIRNILKREGVEFPDCSLIESQGIWSLRLAKMEEVQKVMKYMYDSSNIYLDRKKEIVDSYLPIKKKFSQLSLDAVLEIRALREATNMSFKKIAKLYNVSDTTISNIVNRKKYYSTV